MDEDGGEVAITREETDARLIADEHNTWLPLCNAWYLGRRALRDRERILNVQEKDK